MPSVRNLVALFASNTRANVLIVAAFAMPIVIGGAGLASDTIQWALFKRELQQQADAGAMSGAYARAQNANVVAAVNSDLTATTKLALLNAPTIENGPTVGPYAGLIQAVRVVVRAQKALPFSGMFLSAPPVFTVEATGMLVSTGQYCVIALDPTSTTGISMTGNTTLNLGCGIEANARGPSAITAQGNSTANVTVVAAVGGVPASSSYVSTAKINSYNVPQPDPFANIPDPTVSGCSPNLSVSPHQTLNVTPGCFSGMDIKGTVNFAPGTYYIDGSSGGSFNIGSQASLNGTGVTFVLTSSTAATNPSSIATMSINGGATLTLSAETSGTYAGVLFDQDRRALDGATNLINGNATSFMQGAIYIPGQAVSFKGTAGMQTDCLQLVSKRSSFSGDSSISNNCPSGSGAHAFTGTVVRLVG